MSIAFTIEEHFDQPPRRVFAALVDLESAGEWMPGHVGIERLDDGPLAVGSRWRETRKVFGREATEEFEVTALEPPDRIGLRVDGSRGTSGSGDYRFDYTLSPAAGGTDVRLDAEIAGMSGVMGLLGRLFAGTFRMACRKDLLALKQHLGENWD